MNPGLDQYSVALIAVLAVPALAALIAALLPERAGKLVALVGAAVTFGLTAVLGLAGSAGPLVLNHITPWAEINYSWIPALEVDFHLAVDGVSYPLVVLTGLLTLLCCAYTMKRVPGAGSGRTLMALLLILEVGILGTFLAFDLVLFFLFFEVTLLPMYAVIAGWGGTERRRAARKFVLYTLFGSVLLLLGVFTVVAAAGTADLSALTGGLGLSRDTQYVAFTLFALAFAVKAPLWPLHTWLPDAHTEAPTVGSVLLAGVLLKMGTYGLIRIGVGVAPTGAAWAAPVLAVLAVAAIVIGSLVCLRQTELKRLIAYSSVGHMGFVLLGIATLTVTGVQAALLGNVAHGVITGLLFFLAGAIKDRTHTGDLASLGGLRETAPRLAGLFGFAAIASLGLPGLAGFWGEAFAVVAAVRRGGPLWITLAAIAAVGGALTAAYFLRLLRRVTHGAPPAFVADDSSPTAVALPEPAPSAPAAPLALISRVEWLAWAPLVLLALAVGLVPSLVLFGTLDPLGAMTEALR
ncbi:NuoM family protein [Actinoplanes sp. NPDC049265]|uniref:complex I subunit 4 family protein n=1 Tax=Actinoplanes sp. NPDC049265 TaxID=3363902 RepID=UPI00371DBE70